MKRWWGIRHVRYWLLRGRVARRLSSYGPHGWLLVNLEDADLLARVWRGEA